jgi:hypothetical protein
VGKEVAKPGLGMFALGDAVGYAHLAEGGLHVLVESAEFLFSQALEIPEGALVARLWVAIEVEDIKAQALEHLVGDGVRQTWAHWEWKSFAGFANIKMFYAKWWGGSAAPPGLRRFWDG